MLIHSDLTRRLRGKKVGAAGVGVYVIAGGYCSEFRTNGRIPRAELEKRSTPGGKGRADISTEISVLVSAGFLLEDGADLVLVDWGEWIVGDGEAGEGAE